MDASLCSSLVGSGSVESLESHPIKPLNEPDIGAVWENWVIAEAAKWNASLGGPSDLYFWRSRAQSEVDLVVRTGDRLRAFEIKWKGRRTVGRAFRAMYGVDVEILESGNPFFADHVLGA